MGLLLQMVTVIADALSADEEEIILRLIARNNLKFALMEELYGLEKRYKSPAKLELEQSHTDILSPRNCPPLIEAAVFDCFVFLILAVWLVRNRHLQSCSNKGSNHLLSFTPAYLQFQLQPRFAELKHLILG